MHAQGKTSAGLGACRLPYERPSSKDGWGGYLGGAMRTTRLWRNRVLFTLGALVTLGLVVAAAVANERYEDRRPAAAPTVTDIPKPGPPKSDPVRCPSHPRLGVYRPERLRILGTCVWARGDVLSVLCMDDGDVHVGLFPDRPSRHLINDRNRTEQLGQLVVEIMPGQRLPLPQVGEHLAMFGTWVLDTDHGWNEIHPVWAIRYLDRGFTRLRLPPRRPLYEPNRHEELRSAFEGAGSCKEGEGT